MLTGYYTNKTSKLEKSLDKYLSGLEQFFIQKYGVVNTQTIIAKSKVYYPEIIKMIPYVNAPMYDVLLVANSRMMALKKGLKDEGICVEEFVALMIEEFRNSRRKIPRAIRSMFGKIFLSRFVRIYLKKVAKKVTKNGWPTELITGGQSDDFSMKICTMNCQMVNFMRSVGEDDLIPYCSFADFTNAESLGYSLKQTSTIESGICTFCFNKKGKVYWPESMQKM